MKFAQMWKLSAVVIGLGLSFQASAVPLPCQLSDVKQSGVDSDACAGAFTGNIGQSDPTAALLNNLTNGDWTGSDPSPLDGWVYGAEYDYDKDITIDKGLGVSITYSEATGEWTVVLGSYTEFVIGFKQQNEYAFYYFSAPNPDPSTGTYLLSWGNGGGLDTSHGVLYVRGDDSQQVPEPGTLALLGLGLVGLGMSRRRKA